MPSNDEKCTLTKSLVHFEQKLFVYRNTKNTRIFAYLIFSHNFEDELPRVLSIDLIESLNIIHNLWCDSVPESVRNLWLLYRLGKVRIIVRNLRRRIMLL